ncbi:MULTISPECIES: hypothetical protein [unclassified Yoonia]|nr:MULTISPECIES: hypothetical protein [unclassified Yoonia]
MGEGRITRQLGFGFHLASIKRKHVVFHLGYWHTSDNGIDGLG